MKKRLALSALVFLLVSSPLAEAQIDPRDSVILESKVVYPGVGAPVTLLRVYITNKDTLTNVTLTLVEKSLSGSAYMTLSHPRNFNGVVHRLTSTLGSGFNSLNLVRYNSASPDTFALAAFYDPLNAASAEPPNPARKALWDIKFDTVRADTGRILFDSTRIVDGTVKIFTQFFNKQLRTLKVNFAKGIVTVPNQEAPCPALNVKRDAVLDLADIVGLLNCVFLGTGDCPESRTASDVVILINAVFSGVGPPTEAC